MIKRKRLKLKKKRPPIDFEKLKRVQSEMGVGVGIALGLTAMVNEEVDPDASFFENAINILYGVDDKHILDMKKELQNFINDSYESRS